MRLEDNLGFSTPQLVLIQLDPHYHYPKLQGLLPTLALTYNISLECKDTIHIFPIYVYISQECCETLSTLYGNLIIEYITYITNMFIIDPMEGLWELNGPYLFNWQMELFCQRNRNNFDIVYVSHNLQNILPVNNQITEHATPPTGTKFHINYVQLYFL